MSQQSGRQLTKSAETFSQSGILTALTAALADSQRLLAGREGRNRWRELALLAMMAGVVGVGAQPPPLGLLQPLLSDPSLRSDLFRGLTPGVPALIALSALLCVLLPLSRAFTLAFVAGVVSASPERRAWRAYLRPGVLHFLWSSALTLPLYAVLFSAEWMVTSGAWDELLRADEHALLRVLLLAGGKFLLVLVPWVLLTLPVMVMLYELTPLEMIRCRRGPVSACGTVLRAMRRQPGVTAKYLALRLMLQIAGTALESLALLPCLGLSGLVGGPLLGLTWLVVRALKGTSHGPGVAALTVGVASWAALWYCLLCAILVPVSGLLFAFARRFLHSCSVESSEESQRCMQSVP